MKKHAFESLGNNRAKKSQAQPPADSPIPDVGSPSLDCDAISHDPKSNSPIPDVGSPSLDCDAVSVSHDPQSDCEEIPFPYDAEQQPVAAIGSPPLEHSSYEGDDPALTSAAVVRFGPVQRSLDENRELDHGPVLQNCRTQNRTIKNGS
ncbi:hypothetical protein P692DRAFT_20882511 [Suillus brevipes Sb2]|nr:hypothetical protein P692DRAFT_20882511 [Suillus brevipes Sb2]